MMIVSTFLSSESNLFSSESNRFSSESNLFSNESKRYSRFLTDAFNPITYVMVATIAPRIAVVEKCYLGDLNNFTHAITSSAHSYSLYQTCKPYATTKIFSPFNGLKTRRRVFSPSEAAYATPCRSGASDLRSSQTRRQVSPGMRATCFIRNDGYPPKGKPQKGRQCESE